MNNKLLAVSIVTSIFHTYEACRKDVASIKSLSRFRWLGLRRVLPIDLVQIERNFEINDDTFDAVLLVNHKVGEHHLRALRQQVEASVSRYRPIKNGVCYIPADHLMVVHKSGEIDNFDYYGFYVMKKLY